MKLLFDQNISYKIVSRLEEYFPGSMHVARIQMQESPDRDIWEYAKNNSFTIVSFDTDYSDLSAMLGHPPKVIWLKTGNNKTEFLVNLLIKHADTIKEFHTGKNYENVGCLEIFYMRVI